MVCGSQEKTAEESKQFVVASAYMGVIVGAAAEGVTEISSPHYIDRGYSDIERRLRSIGVKIERIFEED